LGGGDFMTRGDRKKIRWARLHAKVAREERRAAILNSGPVGPICLKLLDMIHAQRGGGPGYWLLDRVLVKPDRWFWNDEQADCDFEYGLWEIGEQLEDTYRITCKPEAVIRRLWEDHKCNLNHDYTPAFFEQWCEPYYAIFWPGEDCPCKGTLSNPDELTPLWLRFGLTDIDVEYAGRLLEQTDGAVGIKQSFESFVVPESRIEEFLRAYRNLLRSMPSELTAELLALAKQTARDRGERLAAATRMDGDYYPDDEIVDDEPQDSPTDYDPDDLDDYESVQSRSAPPDPGAPGSADDDEDQPS
jgi:hypothetical protein